MHRFGDYCSGLQVADLVARPIGIHDMRPTQPNRVTSRWVVEFLDTVRDVTVKGRACSIA